MIKPTICAVGVMALAVSAYAGRMPESVVSVEAAGKGYVQLNVLSTEDNQEYDFQIVRTEDIKRLVGNIRGNNCYLFYFTGTEMLKIPVTHQPCKAVIKELIDATP